MKFNKEITIGNHTISEKSRTFVIAEAGVNHNGDMVLAREMVDIAVEAGADAVKFQSFKAEELILRDVEKAPYQKLTTEAGETQFDMLKRLEMNVNSARELKDYCNLKGILFLSTPFEKVSLEELDKINVDAYKIAATDLTNIQFLRQAAKKEKPIILSAGMCYMEEVEKALNAIYPFNKNVILLQCTANYPIDDSEANISVIRTFKNSFDIIVGYSDHSKGIGASPYAVAIGAKVIEKHFTLDKNMEGPDHKASVSPDELKKLVTEIRKVEKYLGYNIKMPTVSELNTRKSLQKSLVAAVDIKKGEVFDDSNVTAKRTNGEGISALYFDEITGKIAEKDYKVNDLICL